MARKPNGARGDSGAFDGAGIDTIDPTTVTASGAAGAAGDAGDAGKPGSNGSTAGGSGARKGGWPKGKPRGSKSGKGRAASGSEVYLTAKDVAGAVSIIHEIGAMILGAPDFVLRDEESLALSSAGVAVAEHHNIRIPKKYGVWGALAMVVAGIYGPRISARMSIGAPRPAPQQPTAQARPEPSATARAADDLAAALGSVH